MKLSKDYYLTIVFSVFLSPLLSISASSSENDSGLVSNLQKIVELRKRAAQQSNDSKNGIQHLEDKILVLRAEINLAKANHDRPLTSSYFDQIISLYDQMIEQSENDIIRYQIERLRTLNEKNSFINATTEPVFDLSDFIQESRLFLILLENSKEAKAVQPVTPQSSYLFTNYSEPIVIDNSKPLYYPVKTPPSPDIFMNGYRYNIEF